MARTLRPSRLLRTLPLLTAVALLPACGPSNLVLGRSPGAETGTLGPFQRCEPGGEHCRTDPVQDSSRFNARNTTFLALPDCPYGVDRILLQDSGSSDAVAIVQCAAPPESPELEVAGPSGEARLAR